MTGWIITAVISTAWLYWVYDGYARTCAWAGRKRREPDSRIAGASPPCSSVGVLLTVRNEDKVVSSRIGNLLEAAPPGVPFVIYVASDGSTDRTDELVAAHPDPRVRLVRPEGVTGKSAVQNHAVSSMSEEVIVLTDADTEFEPDTIERLVAPYADPKVGCTTGRLALRSAPGAVSAGHRVYWERETLIRRMESRLGVLATATGACMSVRRSLFPVLDPCVGEDCTIPLHVAASGSAVVHVDDAVAFDSFHGSVRGEFRARVRMTERNWRGTWSYPSLLNPFRHPGVAVALWSHKVLRWLTPLPLALFCVAVGAILLRAGYQELLAIGVAVAFVGLVTAVIAQKVRDEVGAVGLALSFVLANVGFAVGVGRALFTPCQSRYR